MKVYNNNSSLSLYKCIAIFVLHFVQVILCLALFVAAAVAAPVEEQPAPAAPSADQDAQNQLLLSYGLPAYGYGLPYAAALPAVKTVAAPVVAAPAVKYVAPAVSAYNIPAYGYGYSYGLTGYPYSGYQYMY